MAPNTKAIAQTTASDKQARAAQLEAEARAYGDLSSLDYAFELSDEITDPKLRMLYESIIHRMRTEAAHLPMNTMQQLVIERIARYYISLLAWERSPKFNMREDTRYTEYWMKMAAQFNSMLMRATPAAQRDAFLERIALVIAGVLKTVEDEDVKLEIFQKFMFAFKKEGLN